MDTDETVLRTLIEMRLDLKQILPNHLQLWLVELLIWAESVELTRQFEIWANVVVLVIRIILDPN